MYTHDGVLKSERPQPCNVMNWTGDSVRAESVHIKTDTEVQQVGVELKELISQLLR